MKYWLFVLETVKLLMDTAVTLAYWFQLYSPEKATYTDLVYVTGYVFVPYIQEP